MLIPSPRHTAADLAVWAELHEADWAHDVAAQVRAKLAVRAMWEIDAFRRAGPVGYCGVSWGKDSVALAELVSVQCPAVPLVWVRVEPVLNPDCLAVRDAFLARRPHVRYEEVVTRCRHDADGWHATGTLEEGFRTACERFGERRLSGVRADESGQRTLSARTHGLATAASCRPLLRWTAAAVFALHAAEGLPTHPAYAMLGGGRWERGRIRVASLGGRRGDGIGRAEWEREYYGDALRRLEVGGG